ncbi:hypothetical protein [Haliangium ochraceum]|nr:hypothetical protein [Haliangium ochraceum]
MLVIESIADLPFRERDPFRLLNLMPDAPHLVAADEGEAEPDEDAEPDDDDDDEGDTAADGFGDGFGVGPDYSYYGYGYARVGSLWLTAEGERDPRPPLRDVLLLAVHTPDDAEPERDDLLLEFWIDPEVVEEAGPDDDYAIHVPLSRFLEIWLPRISGGERAVVLALCNPHHTVLARPAGLPPMTLHYPLGDVTSWCDEAVDGLAGLGHLRLTADAWCVL